MATISGLPYENLDPPAITAHLDDERQDRQPKRRRGQRDYVQVRLTDDLVRVVQPPAREEWVRDRGVPYLALRIQPGGSKSWYYLYSDRDEQYSEREHLGSASDYTVEEPNPGFESDPAYLAEREAHRALAGRLIAVHKLRTTARSLETILGAEEFKRLQDMWAQGGKRYRWSVAFPIVESYEIVGRPKAKDVLGEAAYRRLYQRSSATLRTLIDDERRLIANLELRQIATANSWIGIEDEFRLAEASEINPEVERAIGRDLAALEGMEAERLAKVKRRAAWIADRFVRERQRAGTIICDDCAFDPIDLAVELGVKPRGFLDVHHKNPLDEGVRYTTVADFALLCPTCHRVEHVRLRKSKRQNS